MSDLTLPDEPVHILLRICSGTRIRAVSENTTKGSTDELVPPISLASNASPSAQESLDRIVFGPTRP